MTEILPAPAPKTARVPRSSRQPPSLRALPLASQLEALLFVAPAPTAVARLAQVLEATEDATQAALDELSAAYASGRRGLRLIRKGDRVHLTTARRKRRSRREIPRPGPQHPVVGRGARNAGCHRLPAAPHPRRNRGDPRGQLRRRAEDAAGPRRSWSLWAGSISRAVRSCMAPRCSSSSTSAWKVSTDSRRSHRARASPTGHQAQDGQRYNALQSRQFVAHTLYPSIELALLHSELQQGDPYG